jgi:hypothetical protein
VWNLLDREFADLRVLLRRSREGGREESDEAIGQEGRGRRRFCRGGLSGSQLGASWKDSGNGGGRAPLVRPVSKGLRGWPC